MLFKTKRKLLNERAKVKNRDILINALSSQKEQLKKENQNLRNDLEEEHIENYNLHRKLFEIEQLINNTPTGNYKDLYEFRNKIKKVICQSLNKTDNT